MVNIVKAFVTHVPSASQPDWRRESGGQLQPCGISLMNECTDFHEKVIASMRLLVTLGICYETCNLCVLLVGCYVDLLQLQV